MVNQNKISSFKIKRQAKHIFQIDVKRTVSNVNPLALQVLPEELKKEKGKWDRDYIDKLQREKEAWHTYELPKELSKERKKWLSEVEDKINSEKKNWKNAELPDEIEKERKKWMKLLETTLTKEREKWQSQDLQSAVEKERENWKKTIDEEVEKKLVEKLEIEKDKLQKVCFSLYHMDKFSRRQIYNIFSYYSQKTRFDIAFKLSP